jgi:hypothetical protein
MLKLRAVVKRCSLFSAGILEQSMRARNRVGIVFCIVPPGYIGWRIRFYGIDYKLLESLKIPSLLQPQPEGWYIR